MPATDVRHIIFKIEVDTKDATKATNDQKKSFEDLIKEIGGTRAAFLKFKEASDAVHTRMQSLASYIKGFSNPSVAAWRTSVFAAHAAMGVFSASLKVTQFALSSVGMTFKSLGDASKMFLDKIASAGKNFAIYENDLSHARRTMGLTRQETLELGDAMIDLSSSFEEGGLQAGVSANELVKIGGQLGQLGFNAKDGMEAFKALTATIAKVSLAFGMSSSKAAEMIGILQNLYNLPTAQLENIASSVAALGNSTVATAGQILDIMTRMGSIAGLLGVSAQEAAALAATLREAGISAQVSGTAMTQIFSRLSSDVDKFGEVLGSGGLSGELLRMKIETGDATGALKDVLQAIQNINQTEGKIAAIQALKDLGLSGVRVQSALLALSNNIGGLNENLALSEQAFNENVAVNEAYKAAIDNTYQAWNQTKTLFDTIIKIIGKDMALAFGTFLTDHLNPFIIRFKAWLETSKGAEKIFGETGIIANGLKFLGGALSRNEGEFFAWLDNIDEYVGEILRKIMNEIDKWYNETELDFGQMLGNLATGFQEWLSVNTVGWGEVKQTVKDAIVIIGEVGKALDFIITSVRGANEDIINFFQPFTDLGQSVRALSDDIDSKLASAWDSAKDATGGYVEAIKHAIGMGEELGEVMYKHSELPNIEAATVSLTEKTLQYGESITNTIGLANDTFETLDGTIKATGATSQFLYETGTNSFSNMTRDLGTLTGSFHRVAQDSVNSIGLMNDTFETFDGTIKATGGTTKYFYKTASGAWTNFSRELQDDAHAWFRSNKEIEASQGKVNATLTQTKSAIHAVYMATLLAKQEMTDYTERNKQLLAVQEAINAVYDEQALKRQNAMSANMAFVNSAMAANAESMTAIAAAGGFSREDWDVLRREGMLSASALAQGYPGAQQSMIPQTGNATAASLSSAFPELPTAATTSAQKQSLDVTLVMGDQEVAKMQGVLDDSRQQASRRSFGGEGRAGSSGGR